MDKNQLYKGVFNYQGETNTLYTNAKSMPQAFNFFCKRLSEKYQRYYMYIYEYFIGSTRYIITLEKEDIMKVEIKIDQIIDELKPLIAAEVDMALDRLIAKRSSGAGAPRGGESWSKEEEAVLRTAFCEFVTNHALLTGRSFASISARVKKLFDGGILY